MKKKSNLFENFIHGVFLILGLLTIGCVLLITVYLVISGILAIRGICPFSSPVSTAPREPSAWAFPPAF